MDEKVDILVPPLFKSNGQVKFREEAYRDGNWVGTFNLWIFTRQPEPAIIYQQRSPQATWAPGLLDVTAGGHFQAGEKLTDGLREVAEELGKPYTPSQITSLGRKVYVGFNTDGTSRNNLVNIYFTEDNSPLLAYTLDEKEVYAICACPIKDLLQAHRDPNYSFTVNAITAKGEQTAITVDQASFPENWDDYHRKIAILADRYFHGEQDLVY